MDLIASFCLLMTSLQLKSFMKQTEFGQPLLHLLAHLYLIAFVELQQQSHRVSNL